MAFGGPAGLRLCAGGAEAARETETDDRALLPVAAGVVQPVCVGGLPPRAAAD